MSPLPESYRYMVALSPGVSIAPRRFIEVVTVEHLDPFAAIEAAIIIWRARDDVEGEPETHIWQSDKANIHVERVP